MTDHRRSDLTVRWQLVGVQRAGDEPDIDIITTATETSGFRSSWAVDLGPRNVWRLDKPRSLYFIMSSVVMVEPESRLAAKTSGVVNVAVSK